MKNENNVFVMVFALLLLIVGILFYGTITENKLNNTYTMQVSQTERLEVVPDKMVIELSISSVSENLSQAVEENTRINNLITDEFKDDYELETTRYSIREKTEWNYDIQKSEKLGYEVYNTIKFTVVELDKAGTIIPRAIELGANRVDSIYYQISEESRQEIESELLTQAIENAMLKAENIAQSAGVTLKGIKTIIPSEAYYPVYYNSRLMMDSVEAYAGSTKASEDIDFSPEKQEISRTISIEFEFEN